MGIALIQILRFEDMCGVEGRGVYGRRPGDIGPNIRQIREKWLSIDHSDSSREEAKNCGQLSARSTSSMVSPVRSYITSGIRTLFLKTPKKVTLGLDLDFVSVHPWHRQSRLDAHLPTTTPLYTAL